MCLCLSICFVHQVTRIRKAVSCMSLCMSLYGGHFFSQIYCTVSNHLCLKSSNHAVMLFGCGAITSCGSFLGENMKMFYEYNAVKLNRLNYPR